MSRLTRLLWLGLVLSGVVGCQTAPRYQPRMMMIDLPSGERWPIYYWETLP